MSEKQNGEDEISSQEDISQPQVSCSEAATNDPLPTPAACQPSLASLTSNSQGVPTLIHNNQQTASGNDSIESKPASALPDLKLIYFNKAEPESKSSPSISLPNGISPKVVQLPGGGTGGGGYAYVGTIIKQGKDVSEGQKVLLTPVIKEGSRFILPKGASAGGNPVRSSIVANSSSSPIILSHGQQTRRSFLIHNSALGVGKEVKVPKVLPPAKVPLMVCSTRPHDVTLTSVKPLEISTRQSSDAMSEKSVPTSDSSPVNASSRDLPPLAPILSPSQPGPTSANSVSQSEGDDVELVSDGDMPRPIVKRSLLKTCKLSDLMSLSSPISIPDSPTKSESSPDSETPVELDISSGDSPDAKEALNVMKSHQEKSSDKKVEIENLENGEKTKPQISPTCKLFVSSQTSLSNDSLKKLKGELSGFKMNNSNGHFVRILSTCNSSEGRELSGKHVNALLLKDGKAVVLGTLPKEMACKEQVTEASPDKTDEPNAPGSKQDGVTFFSIQNKVQKTFPLVVSPSQEHRNNGQELSLKSEESLKPMITVRGLSTFPTLVSNIQYMKEGSGLQVKELSKEGAMLERSRKRKGAPLLRDCFRKTIAVKRLEPLSGAAALHPLQVIDWDMKSSIGSLPGSDIKFVVNRYGALQVYEGDERPTINKPDCKGGVEVVYTGGEQSGKDEIGKCMECECYGLLVEFIEERFCSLSCRERNQTRKALVSKRTLSALTKDNTNKKRKLFELALNKARPADEEIDFKVKGDQSPEDTDDAEVSAPTSALTTALRQPVKAGEAMKAAQRLLAPPPPPSEPPKDEVPVKTPAEERKPQRERKSSVDSAVKSSIPGPGTNLTDANKSEKFDWCEYLSQMRSHPAWVRLFKDAFPSQPNLFKVGHRLEAIDPQRPSLFCVVSVAQVKGYRIKLHFDGYGKAHDFWLNADSPNIFPCGFCSSHGIELEPPWGFNKHTFNWSKYMINIKARPAPPRCFVHKLMDSGEPNLFKVGMKLEAVDKKNSYLVCVATVAAVVDHRILIHFDSWDESYDYWTEYYSPNIHPVGWCQRNNYLLTPPNGHKRKTFAWKRYLMETGSEAAPDCAFMVRPPVKFKKGSKLEAVDPRAPHLIRVATIKQILPYQVHVVFDGFPDHFGYWFDDDSPDLHPIGWSSRTGHPLTAPPKPTTSRMCTTPGCHGDGNASSGDLEAHSNIDNCPYSIDNLDEDNLIPDRLSVSKSGNKSSQQSEGKKDISVTQRNVRKAREGPKDADSEEINKDSTFLTPYHGSISLATTPSPGASQTPATSSAVATEKSPAAAPVVIKSEPLDDEETPSDASSCLPSQPVNETILMQVNDEVLKAACDKFVSGNMGRVNSTSEVMAEELLAWDSRKVTAFVEALLHRATNAFYNNKVDGEGLLMLNEEDLSQRLSFNETDVSTIYSNIVTLRNKFALQSK